MSAVDIAAIEAAARRLEGVAVRTPLISNATLDELAGGRVLIKPECLQRTGSFKIRGAWNRLAQLSAEEAAAGVVAWSSGNHAQGVACAGQLLGIRTTIVMPDDAPQAKLAKTRAYGGEVVTYDRYSEDREAIARALAAECGAALVPSYDHEHVIVGQGTVGLEIADDAASAGFDVDQVVICCGGGGLTAGSATALKARLPNVDVFTAEPAGFDDTARSLKSGEFEHIDSEARSICDALLSPEPGRLTLPINRALGVRGLVVSDEEVCDAMRFAFRELKLVVEPGGAVALAAVLKQRLSTAGRTTAVVISGGNVDAELFARCQAEPS